MVTDPVADLLIRIKNGYYAHKVEVTMPHSNLRENIANILLQYEFVEDVKVKDLEDNKKNLTVYLRYGADGKAALTDVKQISTPGRRVYRQYKSLYRVRGGYGILIVSTPKGLMIGEEAKEQRVGGEVLAEIW